MYQILFFQEEEHIRTLNAICLKSEQPTDPASYYFTYSGELTPDEVAKFPAAISKHLRDSIVKYLEQVYQKNKDLAVLLRKALNERFMVIIGPQEQLQEEETPPQEPLTEEVSTKEEEQETQRAESPPKDLPSLPREQTTMETQAEITEALAQLLKLKALMSSEECQQERAEGQHLIVASEEQLEAVRRAEQAAQEAELALEHAKNVYAERIQDLNEEIASYEVMKKRLEDLRTKQSHRLDSELKVLDNYRDELEEVKHFLDSLGIGTP